MPENNDKVLITVNVAGKADDMTTASVIKTETGKSLLSILQSNNYYVPAICASRGKCGKCAVIIKDCVTEPTLADKQFFTSSRLAEGYRLSCCFIPQNDVEVTLLSGDESDFAIQTSHKRYTDNKPVASGASVKALSVERLSNTSIYAQMLNQLRGLTGISIDALRQLSLMTRQDNAGCDCFGLIYNNRLLEVRKYSHFSCLGIAIDIGTTTIGLELVDLLTGSVIADYSLINRQRAYGADVISRIQHANLGNLAELTETVVEDICLAIAQLCGNDKERLKAVHRMVIAGNTTMIHLLLGLDCQSLGIYPFTPAISNIMEYRFTDIFADSLLDCPVTIIPSITTYVGGDITAGMVICGLNSSSKPQLLIDIGTNGEMALGTDSKILCASTAAGPALEGGNISRGMGSVKGAISYVKYNAKMEEFEYKTIGDEPPIGICGTGVIDIVAELLRNGIIDEAGYIDDHFGDKLIIAYDANNVPICFTQKDVREVQLAKSAICAGIHCLVEGFGISFDSIDSVYLAGGFGYTINIENAITLGLFPIELSHKIKAIGNTSLGGAEYLLLNEQSQAIFNNIQGTAKELNLSADTRFNELYIDNMMFEITTVPSSISS